MTLMGDAILKICHPLRLNNSVIANTDHYLHAPIQVRYAWEPDKYIGIPAWSYPEEEFYKKAHEFYEIKHKELKITLIEHLEEAKNDTTLVPE